MKRLAATSREPGKPTLRGGIDLGGTKIQTAIVDAERQGLGEARRPTPTERRPGGRRRRRWPRRMREAAEAAGVETGDLAGVGVGSPGDADEKTGVVSARPATCPAGRAASRSPKRCRSDARHRGADRQRRPGRDRGRVPPRRRARVLRRLIGVFWGTGVGGGLVLDGKPWLGPRRRRRDRPHGRQARRRQVPLRAQGLHGGLRGARGDGSRGAAPARGGRQDRPLQADGEARRDRADERHLGAGARPRRPARREADRPRDRGARHRRSPRPSTCSTPRR